MPGPPSPEEPDAPQGFGRALDDSPGTGDGGLGAVRRDDRVPGLRSHRRGPLLPGAPRGPWAGAVPEHLDPCGHHGSGEHGLRPRLQRLRGCQEGLLGKDQGGQGPQRQRPRAAGRAWRGSAGLEGVVRPVSGGSGITEANYSVQQHPDVGPGARRPQVRPRLAPAFAGKASRRQIPDLARAELPEPAVREAGLSPPRGARPGCARVTEADAVPERRGGGPPGRLRYGGGRPFRADSSTGGRAQLGPAGALERAPEGQ
eukprot:9493941-Pyramimonas_sp.AAC.1